MEKEKLNKIQQEMLIKQSDIVKQLVKNTFEALRDKEHARDIIQEEIRILKHDLQDFKEGRLDRIIERHEKSKIAMDTSVFEINEKDTIDEKSKSQWYKEYVINIKGSSDVYSINNSVMKKNACGTYLLSDGSTKYI